MCGPSAVPLAPSASGEPGGMGRLPVDVEITQAGSEVDRDTLADVPVDRDTLVDALARVLSHLCLAGVGRPRANVGFEAKRAPSITIWAYLQRLSDHFCCSNACLIASLVYMDRAAKLHSSHLVSPRSVHRMMLASMVLAAKFCDDSHYKNEHYATIGGIELQELNALEGRFLRLINWRLHIMEEEYDLYKNHVLIAARGTS
uniref:G1/S-specific cyclin n=1 Tax=Prorocentrum donghaiense TaxID=257771 RepID=A0A220T1I4_9DINO|nr:G1/S-specific cyclin [Prorocentrum donghaiense]